MKVTFVDSKLHKHCFDLDDAASVECIKNMLVRASLVPVGCCPKLAYQKKVLMDEDSLSSIGYVPHKSICFLCVRSSVAIAVPTIVDPTRPLSPATPDPKVGARVDPASLPIGSSTPLQEGTRVRIQGLQTGAAMNGRTGVICSAYNEERGRWTVQVDADDKNLACQLSIRPANLVAICTHNFSTQWLDEDGCVWPKNVNFSLECPKGHALAELGGCSGSGCVKPLVCRICHITCQRDNSHAATWMVCSVISDCCFGYAVCSSCSSAPNVTPAISTSASEVRTQVSSEP